MKAVHKFFETPMGVLLNLDEKEKTHFPIKAIRHKLHFFATDVLTYNIILQECPTWTHC